MEHHSNTTFQSLKSYSVYSLSHLDPLRHVFITDTCFKTENLIQCIAISFSLHLYHQWEIIFCSFPICKHGFVCQLMADEFVALFEKTKLPLKGAPREGYSDFHFSSLYRKSHAKKVVPDFFTLWSLIQMLNQPPFTFSYFFIPVLIDVTAYENGQLYTSILGTTWIPLCPLLRVYIYITWFHFFPNICFKLLLNL